MEELTDDQFGAWEMEELPEVYGMIGAAALPALQRFLLDQSKGMWQRVTVGSAVARIGILHPEVREKSVEILTQQLEVGAENDPPLNAFLISNLIDMKVVEAAPFIERAFAADVVDESVEGNWYDVQLELGLTTEEEVEGKLYNGVFPGLQALEKEQNNSIDKHIET